MLENTLTDPNRSLSTGEIDAYKVKLEEVN
jgi:hypothetical protein